jgi:hypothetical protein
MFRELSLWPEKYFKDLFFLPLPLCIPFIHSKQIMYTARNRARCGSMHSATCEQDTQEMLSSVDCDTAPTGGKPLRVQDLQQSSDIPMIPRE